MTDEQRYSGEFERFSRKIVEFLFQGTKAKIYETRQNKDGGYDIIVECLTDHVRQRAFFECKLRNKNLTFRDIAANAIIAFNHGTVAFVAVTNHDFTQQTGKQLQNFHRNTILNIKIITGEELQALIRKSKTYAPTGLLKILRAKANRRKDDFKALRLDFDGNIIAQLFSREASDIGNNEQIFLQIYPNKIETLIQRIVSGYLVAVTGYWGVGKEELIHAAIARCGKHVIEIDAQMFDTKDPLLLTLLSKIWGIPEIEVFSKFTRNQVAEITREINGSDNNEETIRTLTALFNDSFESKHASAAQNYLISQYVAELLLLHKDDVGFVVYIDNLQFATKETYDFLIYLIRQLNEKRLGCIIRYQDPEYQISDSVALLEHLKGFPRYAEIELMPLEYDAAVRYVKYICSELSEHSANVIVRQAGTRIKSLSFLITYLLCEKGISPADDQRLAQSIQGLTENDIPSLMGMLLSGCREHYPEVFELARLLDCRVDIKIFTLMGVQLQTLDRLIAAGLFRMDRNIVTAQNEFVREWIRNMKGGPGFAYAFSCAESILQKLNGQKNKYVIEKISLYHALGEDETALALLEGSLHGLTRDKQYTALGRGLALAIEMARSLKDTRREAKYLVQALDLMTIQKELTSELARERIEQLNDCINCGYNLPNYLLTALVYFRIKRAFKLGVCTESDPAVRDGKSYYEQCIGGSTDDNEGDWLGRICSCYALTVKSTQGNEAALQVFESARKALPDSFDLQREYLSHLACMELFEDPESAFRHYQKILDLFELQAANSAELPFHEYGDLAMSQLIAGNLSFATELVGNAIKICQSNGLLDEEGRNINIRGCIDLCEKREEAAEASFREATAIMRYAGCWNYAWRSELNFIQLRVRKGDKGRKLQDSFEKLYAEFRNLQAEKIAVLSASDSGVFCHTVEYHALLVFGACWAYLRKGTAKKNPVPVDFNLGAHTPLYLSHTKSYIAGKAFFMETPYLKNGYIFLVG